MEHEPNNAIWTIGHSNRSIDEFVALLEAHGIAAIVDVRSAPYSRYASHFNRLDLEHALTQRGIAYRYEGKRLGGRPTEPHCYFAGVAPDQAERPDFLKLVDYDAVRQKPWFQEALNEVIQLGEDQRVALMCSEENPDYCHRHRLIGPALVARGIAVLHIRRDGSVHEASFTKSTEPAPIQAALF